MERKSARKMVTILAFSVICLTLVSVPTVSAQPNKPLRCEMYAELNWDWVATGEGPSWIGTVSGDIEGESYTFLIGATFPGITEHFEETGVFETDVGSIEIYQKGVWSFKSFEFKANGYVTAATGDWEYLVGARVHVRGVTSQFPVDFGEPVTAEGTMLICGYAA